jgi:hypothetical protein
MSALSTDEIRELTHLFLVTRDGAWSHRQPKATPEKLVRRGYAERRDPEQYRLTAAGTDAYRALTKESEGTR